MVLVRARTLGPFCGVCKLGRCTPQEGVDWSGRQGLFPSLWCPRVREEEPVQARTLQAHSRTRRAGTSGASCVHIGAGAPVPPGHLFCPGRTVGSPPPHPTPWPLSAIVVHHCSKSPSRASLLGTSPPRRCIAHRGGGQTAIRRNKSRGEWAVLIPRPPTSSACLQEQAGSALGSLIGT